MDGTKANNQKSPPPYVLPIAPAMEKNHEAATHHVEAVVEENSDRFVDTPTMWEQYMRGKLVISPPMSSYPPTKQQYDKPQLENGGDIPLTEKTPSPPQVDFDGNGHRMEEGNFSAGSRERLVPDSEDEYSRWKKEMQLLSGEADSPDPSLHGEIPHPHVPKEDLPAENYYSGQDSPGSNKYHHRLPKVQKYSASKK